MDEGCCGCKKTWLEFPAERRKEIQIPQLILTPHKGQLASEPIPGDEVEWNNKDPFFDRDLENFKRLHAEGAISVGIIVTRGSSLHEHMREFIREFAQEQNLSSFEALDRIG